MVPELPKTRSGKIMRRLLRDVAAAISGDNVPTWADGRLLETWADQSEPAANDRMSR